MRIILGTEKVETFKISYNYLILLYCETKKYSSPLKKKKHIYTLMIYFNPVFYK